VDANQSSFGNGEENRQEGQPGKPAPEEPIMARLPRSRPKRETAARKPARPRAAGTTKSSGPGASAKRPARPRPSSRPRGPAGSSSPAARTRSRTATARARAATVRTSANSAPAAPRARADHAPGLPRLALDGAIEAAKLPVKVSANITIRALDAITKGLRRR
jgi:hypothetical protein